MGSMSEESFYPIIVRFKLQTMIETVPDQLPYFLSYHSTIQTQSAIILTTVTPDFLSYHSTIQTKCKGTSVQARLTFYPIIVRFKHGSVGSENRDILTFYPIIVRFKHPTVEDKPFTNLFLSILS